MDYTRYKFTVIEAVGYFAAFTGIAGIIAFFFYRSIIAFGIMFLFIPVYFKIVRKERKEAVKKKLADEFSETLLCVSANMMAGYSPENAFCESYKDIVMFYGDKSLMAGEILWIKKGLSVNRTLEDLISELSERSDIDDIRNFAEVFSAAKRNGGNLKDALSDTAGTVREKLRVEKEIDVIISEKLFELRVMEVVPFLILIYIGSTSKGYFDVLYNNVTGVLIMSAGLLVYAASIVLGRKIIKIEV